jgi:PmbA protein
MNNNDRLTLAEWVIKQAVKFGADEAAVGISGSRGIEVEFRDGKLDKLQESTQNSLNLQIYANHRYSGHSTSDMKKETLENFIKEAVAATKYLTEDEFRMLPDPKFYPIEKNVTDLQLEDSEFSKVETSERIRIASEIEKAALKVSDRIISASSGYSDSSYNVAKMHSNGFSGSYSGTMFSAGAEVSVKDDEGGRPEDWYYGSVRFFKDLPDPEMLGTLAAKRALSKIGQKKIKSGRYNMLVENRAAGRLISVLQGAMTARAIQQKASFLDGMLGKQIASEKLTLIDDPFLVKGMNSRFFDNDGIAAKKRTMIEKGVLKNYYIDNYYGKKIGMEPTTGGPSNLVFEYGIHSFEENIKLMNNGIIINGFIGGNSNSTTGDFSFGIVGMFVRDGEIIHPLNEMNISGNAKDFFNLLEETGNDPYEFSSYRVPSMFFKDVNFSGS